MPGITVSMAVITAAALAVHPGVAAPEPGVPARAPAQVCVQPLAPGNLLQTVRDVLEALRSGGPRCLPGQRGTEADPAPGDDKRDEPRGALARLPGELLDLRQWYLTLPSGTDGDPEDVQNPDLGSYTGEFFRLNEDGDGVVFRANAGGVTTENSSYPRSELREMSGTEHASWSNTTGTHILDVRQAITEVPTVKPEVVAAQIHGGDDDVLQIRLEGPTLSVQYADGEEQIVLDPNYQLGTPYDLRIVAAKSRIVVFYDGARKAEIGESGTGWYWKVGAYTQSNPEKGDEPDAVGEVVVYSLNIEHTSA